MTKGGNRNLFALMKEYDIHDEPLSNIYFEQCMVWYRNMHQAKMDEVYFDQPKPGINMRDKFQK